MEIDAHIGCAMSGLTADARTMVDHARVTSQTHAFTYDEKIGVESCTQAVCDLALRFGESVEDDDALMVSCGASSGCVSKTKKSYPWACLEEGGVFGVSAGQAVEIRGNKNENA